MITTITFDLDDTLWAVEPVIEVANQRLYHWFAEHAPRFIEHFDDDYHIELQQLTHQQFPERSYSVTAVRQTMIELGLQRAGYQGDELAMLCSAAFGVFLEARNEVDFFKHALPMIETLHRDFTLGAITNGNADIQRVGLGNYFDFAFHADHIGAGKPHPPIFSAMLEHTRQAPEQVLHIGDSLEHDIQGANNAGLHSLWVNLNGLPADPAIPADIEVRCLSDIPATIQQYRSQLTAQP